MAQQQQQQQSGPPQLHCRDCGLHFDSVTSLDVHLNYHKENLLVKWATQATNSTNVQGDEASNKSNGKASSRVTTAPADSSDAMIKSEASPSPYYSGSPSPFQPPQEHQRYSPMFGGPTPPPQQNGSAPSQHTFHQTYAVGFQELRPPSTENSGYFAVPANTTEGASGFILGSATDFPSSSSSNSVVTSTPSSSSPSPSSYQQQRYHPYLQYSDSSQRGSNGVGPSGPGPCHHQCDKCGYLCDSSTALIDHLNLAHPPTPRGYQEHIFRFKTDHEESPAASANSGAEILDLDSHKVHQIYQPDGGSLSRHPHSVSSMLWGDKSQQQQQQFGGVTSTMGPSPSDGIVVPQQRVVAPSPAYGHLLPPQQMLTPSSLSSPKSLQQQQQQQQNSSSSNQSWKSNEARRPKTYNCSACNKWFTSSGHLKRHYNTTLHKNAVKQSGVPDPATQPISNHHHPNRPVAPDQHTNSPSPAGGEDSSTTSPPNMLAGPSVTTNSLEAQQPSAAGGLQHFLNSPSSQQQQSYNNQPSSSVHTPPSPQQPHSHHYMLGAAVSPPIHQPTPPPHHLIHHPIPQHLPTHPSSLQMSNHHLGEMYSPNELPPHISMLQSFQPHHQLQAMVQTSTNNHHLTTITTGEEMMFHIPSPMRDHNQLGEQEGHPSEPLPSFSQIGHHLFGSAMASYAATYDLVNSGSTVENVGGLISSPGIVQLPQDYQHSTSPSNNTFWIESFDDQQANHPYSPDNTTLQTSESSMGSCENVLSSDGGQECPTSSNGDIEMISTNPTDIDDSKPEIIQEDVPVISSSVEESLNKIAQNNNNTIFMMNISNCNNNRKKSKPNTSVATGDVLKCVDCDKVFNRACYLTQHNKSFHSGHKPYKCSRCGKRFPVECIYQEHIGKHAGDKPYKCESCPKQFNHKTDLRRHMCLHTGEKPFACHVCGKGFIRKDHMLKHVETHRRKAPHHHIASRQVLAAAAP